MLSMLCNHAKISDGFVSRYLRMLSSTGEIGCVFPNWFVMHHLCIHVYDVIYCFPKKMLSTMFSGMSRAQLGGCSY